MSLPKLFLLNSLSVQIFFYPLFSSSLVERIPYENQNDPRDSSFINYETLSKTSSFCMYSLGGTIILDNTHKIICTDPSLWF